MKTGELKIWHADDSIRSVSLDEKQLQTLGDILVEAEERSHSPMFADRREAIIGLYNVVTPALLDTKEVVKRAAVTVIITTARVIEPDVCRALADYVIGRASEVVGEDYIGDLEVLVDALYRASKA